MVGKILFIIGLIGLVVLGLLYVLAFIKFYCFSGEMVNVGDVYICIKDKKNPFIDYDRYAEIIEKEFDEDRNLWVKYVYFVQPGDTKIYDTNKHYDIYEDFLINHKLENSNKK